MQDELTVYTKPGCPWCLAVTGHLLNEGYEFAEVDILKDEAALEEMKEISGQNLAPTIRLRERVVGNCTVAELKRLLQELNVRP